MSVIFDNHCHCFPPLGHPGEAEVARLAEHQYHVRFHGQGVTRKRDNVRISEHILAGEKDGISWQPDVNFRVELRVDFNCSISMNLPESFWLICEGFLD